jgi:hypothetical protein
MQSLGSLDDVCDDEVDVIETSRCAYSFGCDISGFECLSLCAINMNIEFT